MSATSIVLSDMDIKSLVNIALSDDWYLYIVEGSYGRRYERCTGCGGEWELWEITDEQHKAQHPDCKYIEHLEAIEQLKLWASSNN